MLSVRIWITKNVQINLSPQTLLSCDGHNYGWQGGYVDRSIKYLQDYGIVT